MIDTVIYMGLYGLSALFWFGAGMWLNERGWTQAGDKALVANRPTMVHRLGKIYFVTSFDPGGEQK